MSLKRNVSRARELQAFWARDPFTHTIISLLRTFTFPSVDVVRRSFTGKRRRHVRAQYHRQEGRLPADGRR